MDSLRALITAKPKIYISITVFYLLFVSFLKWLSMRDIWIVLFVLGGIVGMFFLDAAEQFFALKVSPFRTVFFKVLFVIVSFFVVTSSGSLMASGLVLSIYGQLIFLELEKLQLVGYMRILFLAFFLIETYYFIA